MWSYRKWINSVNEILLWNFIINSIITALIIIDIFAFIGVYMILNKPKGPIKPVIPVEHNIQVRY